MMLDELKNNKYIENVLSNKIVVMPLRYCFPNKAATLFLLKLNQACRIGLNCFCHLKIFQTLEFQKPTNTLKYV